jgi:DNA-binding NarL/FixJ family response regulator
VRVVIADDSTLLREGLARLLAETGVEVTAMFGDAEALEEYLTGHEVDVAIVDIRMPPTYTHEGAEAAVRLRGTHPTLGILLLSQAVETQHAAELLERDASHFGYLLKDRVVDVTTLRRALDSIVAGGTVLDPDIVRGMMHAHDRREPLHALSEREREVLSLMAEGRSNSAIADRLVVAVKTVESHIANIFTKLGLHDAPNDHRRVLAVLTALQERSE